MFQQIEWKDAYQLWRYTYYEYRDTLSAPVIPETIYVKYECGGDVYGFDWLEKDDVQKRKSMIANDPVQFSTSHAHRTREPFIPPKCWQMLKVMKSAPPFGLVPLQRSSSIVTLEMVFPVMRICCIYPPVHF